jgi:hypothetical protein
MVRHVAERSWWIGSARVENVEALRAALGPPGSACCTASLWWPRSARIIPSCRPGPGEFGHARPDPVIVA